MTKEEIVKYLQNNEMDIAQAESAFLLCDLVFGAYANSEITTGVPFSPTFCFFRSKNGRSSFHQIIPKKFIENLAKSVYFDYLKNPESLINKMSAHRDLGFKLDKIWENYSKNRSKYSNNNELVKIWEELINVSELWWHYGAIGEDKGGIILREIVPKFAERHGYDLGKADEIFNILSHPEEQTALNKERESFLKICLDVLSGKKDDKRIESHIEKYFWFKTDFYKTEEITPESLIKEAKEEIVNKKESGIRLELESIKQSLKKLHTNKASLVKEIKLTEEDKQDLYFAEQTIQWVDQRKIAMMKDFYYIFMIIKDRARISDLPYDDLVILSVKESTNFIVTGKGIRKEEAEARNTGMFIILEKGKDFATYYGQDANEIFEAATHFKKEDKIKGQVASTGGIKKLEGKVRVVLSPSKDQFNEGEILVTSMTRIEFLPLMRKAKAIITDEGGIACHAAIVSRELNIPAIIGTKVSTRVLKDGDLVEMDMEKGVIKKYNG